MPRPPIPPAPPFPPGSPGSRLLDAGWRVSRNHQRWNKPALSGPSDNVAAWIDINAAVALQKEQDDATPAVVINLD
jgi:hypothetical protein